MAQEHVPVWSFETLATKYKVLSIDALKTDCEGADCEVLSGLMSFCDKWAMTFPRSLSFETDELICPKTVRRTILQLDERGSVRATTPS